MTRENKLALVIGFALILFVGVLVSDHFSAAANERAADFSGVAPALVATTLSSPRIIDLTSPQSRPAPAQPDTRPQGGPAQADQSSGSPNAVPDSPEGGGLRNFVPYPGPEEKPVVHMGLSDLKKEFGADDGIPTHDVRSGETLFSICKQHYGNGALVKALARYNEISDPTNLKVGRRLRVPSQAALTGAATPPPSGAPAQQPTSPPANSGVYVVKAGDTLSRISREVFGTPARYQELIDLNADSLSDPDNLRVGSKLKVPNSAVR